jgi:hypothetical protein
VKFFSAGNGLPRHMAAMTFREQVGSGAGIEISDPDFRQKAEGLRMPHTAIGRNRPRASGQFHDTVVNLEGTAEQDGKCGI